MTSYYLTVSNVGPSSRFTFLFSYTWQNRGLRSIYLDPPSKPAVNNLLYLPIEPLPMCIVWVVQMNGRPQNEANEIKITKNSFEEDHVEFKPLPTKLG